MSIMIPPPESESTYGYVVARFIRQVADSVDGDDKPDILPGSGSVKFVPRNTFGRTHNYSAFIAREIISAPLDDNGIMVRRRPETGEALESGIFLAVGVYDVQFNISGANIPTFSIEVLERHTKEEPLDLAVVAPYVPPVGATVQLVPLPSSPREGYYLGWSSGALAWLPESIGEGPKIVVMSQSDWDELEDKDPQTLYFIREDS